MQIYNDDVTVKYYKYVYETYTLKSMTGDSSPEGLVSYTLTGGTNSTSRYKIFFNGSCTIDAYNSQAKYGRSIRYTFPKKIAPDNYVFTYTTQKQANVTNKNNQWVAIYEDGTTVEIMNNLATNSSKTYTVTFTAEKPVVAIQLNMTASCGSNQYCNIFIKGVTIRTEGYDVGVVRIISSELEATAEDYDYKRVLYKAIKTPRGYFAVDEQKGVQ